VTSPEQTVQPDCLFCRIISGEIPSSPVYETESVYAFPDIRPVGPTHVLVVPKVHRRDAADLRREDGQLLADLFAAATEVAALSGLSERGYRLVLNVGDDAGNTVPHLHLHVIGGRQLAWPPG
jgi:histidine triad (HIT) family protein